MVNEVHFGNIGLSSELSRSSNRSLIAYLLKTVHLTWVQWLARIEWSSLNVIA